jgi:hypothetical protein
MAWFRHASYDILVEFAEGGADDSVDDKSFYHINGQENLALCRHPSYCILAKTRESRLRMLEHVKFSWKSIDDRFWSGINDEKRPRPCVASPSEANARARAAALFAGLIKFFPGWIMKMPGSGSSS